MKKPTYILSIPQPCNERWDDMTPTEKGRYCASCQKQVVDFSGLSDREVIQLIKQASGKVCGRLHPHQLDRPMVFEPWAQRASVRFSGFFAGLMLLSSFEGQGTTQFRKETSGISRKVHIGPRTDFKFNDCPQEKQDLTIQGRVVDADTGEPVKYANVGVKSSKVWTSTKEDGTFSLVIPEKMLKKRELVLRCALVGYQTVELNIQPKEVAENFVEIEFQIIPGLLMGKVSIDGKYPHSH